MSDDKQMHPARKIFRKIFVDDMPVQWVVPVYQRKYVWESGEDNQIPGMWVDWKDQTEKLLNPDPKNPIRPHYFGAIIYYLHDWKEGDKVQKRDLVDGQQRLTTFQLALVALRDVGMELGYKKAININDYIFNTSVDRSDDTKLSPSRNDRKIFKNILVINKSNETFKDKSAITKAYNCFNTKIKQFIEDNKSEERTVNFLIDLLKDALLDTFQVVTIHLGEDDDPQQIFASLNGKGEPLTPFDLVRNDIFYRVVGKDEAFAGKFENDWGDNFETQFWRDKASRGRTSKTNANHFIVEFLIAQTAREVKQHKIFTDYKNYIKENHFSSVADELDTLIKYGKTYYAMSKHPKGATTNRISKMLKLWGSSTMNPVVMWIDTRPNLSTEEKQEMFLLIESYIIRRYIDKLSTRALNKIAPDMLARMHEAERQGESIIGTFKDFLKTQITPTTKMPKDSEILSACDKKNIYRKGDSNKLVYIFEHIEKHIRPKKGENVTIDTNDLNIEHIMPQSWAKNWLLKNGTKVLREEYWEAREEGQQLDDNARNLMEERQVIIDTIGNLTLVTLPLNSAVSNGSWEEKKPEFDKESVLRINRDIIKEAKWDEDTIKARSEKLAGYINEIWKHPSSE